MSNASGAVKNAFSFSMEESRFLMGGCLLIDTLEAMDRGKVARSAQGAAALDIAGLTQMDTAGAWFLVDVSRRVSVGVGKDVAIEGASEAQAQLIDTVRRNLPPEDAARAGKRTLADRLEAFGKTILRAARTAVELERWLGKTEQQG